jgi:hypothetical protein
MTLFIGERVDGTPSKLYELELDKQRDGWHVISSWNSESIAGPFKTKWGANKHRKELYLSCI